MKKVDNNKLRIRLKGETKSAEALKAKIQEKVQEVKVVQGDRLDKMAAIHISDMDTLTKEESIKERLKAALDELLENLRISSIRPAFGSTLNETVILNARMAKKLVDKGRVKIS